MIPCLSETNCFSPKASLSAGANDRHNGRRSNARGAALENARLITALAAWIAVSASAAVAQPPTTPSQMGIVTSTEGPQGSVIVVRGSQAYALMTGDALFEGDRIVTRSNGEVTFSANDCEKTLEPTSSIVVDDEICDVVPIVVANADPIAKVALAPASGAEVGAATPFLLPGLLATGGAAAAVAGSRSSSSVVH
jgi:hypothetical protein